MKNVLLYSVLAGVMLAGGASTLQAQQVKIATVDMKRVFENYYKTKDAEQRINEARNQAKKELEDRMESYKKETEDVQKLNDEIGRPELSKDAKETKTKQRDEKIGELKNMEREIREFQSTREKQLQDQTMRMRAGIVEQINKVVTDRVKSDQFDLVFDRSGQSLNGVPFLLYAKDSYDFTTDVITALNKEKANDKDAGDAAPAAAPAARPAAPTPAAPKKK